MKNYTKIIHRALLDWLDENGWDTKYSSVSMVEEGVYRAIAYHVSEKRKYMCITFEQFDLENMFGYIGMCNSDLPRLIRAEIDNRRKRR